MEDCVKEEMNSDVFNLFVLRPDLTFPMKGNTVSRKRQRFIEGFALSLFILITMLDATRSGVGAATSL